jgi:hypothetical protein
LFFFSSLRACFSSLTRSFTILDTVSIMSFR